MSKITASFLTFLLMGLSGFSQNSGRAGDEAAVRHVIEQYLEARNQADAAKTRAVFTEDADQLVSSGEWRRGRDSLLEGAMAMSNKHTAKSSIHLDAVRFVTDDVALADGDYVTHSAPGATRKMRTTFVMKREGGKWKIAAIRNMLPAPLAR